MKLLSLLRAVLDEVRVAVLHPGWSTEAETMMVALGATAHTRRAARAAVVEQFGRSRAYPPGEAAHTAAMLYAAGVTNGSTLRHTLRSVKGLTESTGMPLETARSIVCSVLAVGVFRIGDLHYLEREGLPIARLVARTRGEPVAALLPAIYRGEVPANDFIDAIPHPRSTR